MAYKNIFKVQVYNIYRVIVVYTLVHILIGLGLLLFDKVWGFFLSVHIFSKTNTISENIWSICICVNLI